MQLLNLYSPLYCFWDHYLYTYLKPASIPEAVLIIGDYQYKAAFVADQEVNLVACCTELMMRCQFK